MRPKTKLDHYVVSLNKRVKEPSERFYNMCRNSFVPRGSYLVGKKLLHCFSCNTSSDMAQDPGETSVCPSCGTKLRMLAKRVTTHNQSNYLCIITTVADMQLIRTFYVKMKCRYRYDTEYLIEECMREYINEKGEIKTIARNSCPFPAYRSYPFAYGSAMELRKNTYEITPDLIYRPVKVLPILKRNGFKGRFYGKSPVTLFRHLLTDTIAETLIKIKQISLLQSYLDRPYKVKPIWQQIKICFKQHYIINDFNIWSDYLGMAKECGYNITDPVIVCPDNLRKEHMMVQKQVMYMRNKKRDDDTEREKIKRRRKNKRKRILRRYSLIRFERKTKQFENLVIKKDGVVITPLKDLQDFYEEGLVMNHCVYVNQYHKRLNSLLLSAKVKGQRMETVEIDLRSLEPVQVAGKSNHLTPYHETIMRMLKDNKHVIAKHAKRKIAS